METVKKSKKWLLILVGVIALSAVLAVGGIWLYNGYIVPERQYKEAVQLRNDNKYGAAADIFTKLGGYKDSEQQVKATIYDHALYESNENQNYYLAAQLLRSIEDYKDSADLIPQLEYAYATKLYNMGNIEEAKTELTKLGDYKDTQQYLKNIELVENLEGYWQCDDNPFLALYFSPNWTFIMSAAGSSNSFSYSIDNNGTIFCPGFELTLNGNKLKQKETSMGIYSFTRA